MFTALAYTAASAIQTSQVARQNQQAIDLANERVEQLRESPWGSLGHDPDAITCPDPELLACTSTPTRNGEELVLVDGGIGFDPAQPSAVGSQISEQAVNNITYTVKTYVTGPDDATGDYRRVTVMVQWNDYGQVRTKTAETVVTHSTRGLPLPDFTLTPIGSQEVVVNPGATAVWGFELTNQGAPDQWNITSSDLPVDFYLDDGNDVFNPEDNTPLTDHNSDGIPDTGRLDPQQSFTFWAVYAVPASATNGTQDNAVTTVSVSQETAATASKSVTDRLTVTDSIITASPTPTPTESATPSSTPSPSETEASCPDTDPAPTPAPVSGFSRIAYTLHNSGNTSWPTIPLPASDPIPGTTAQKPMAMNLTGDAIPSGRTLPELSTDLSPTGTNGRLVYANGAFSGGASHVADWQTNAQSKKYSGSIVLRLWADEAPGATGTVDLTAQLYQYRSSGNKVETLAPAAVSKSVAACNGFRQVSFTFPITGTMTLTSKYVLGVRVWSSSSTPARIAYDHADYRSTLTVVEQ